MVRHPTPELRPAMTQLVAFTLTLAVAIPLAASAQQQTQFPGANIPQFVDALPAIPALDGTAPLEIHMREFEAQPMSTGTLSAGVAPNTWVWGYVSGPAAPEGPSSTYVGPLIVARRGIPTEVKYVNDLGDAADTRLLAYSLSTDQTVHWADPLGGQTNLCSEQAMEKISAGQASLPGAPCDEHYAGPIPATVHLHGGEVPAAIDGGPDSWFTSDPSLKGTGFYSMDGSAATNYAIYRYPNPQESEPLWFHDHTLGVTRLNVYAGLAGLYLLTDPPNDPPNLPPLTPLVIQDRMFDSNGQLFFPAGPGSSPTPDHPYWVPEFFGDSILVNGKTWPFLEVEPKRYRFLILNASNSRAYRLRLSASGREVPIWQIGTDGGYLDRPVRIEHDQRRSDVEELLLMPAERADVIIDFARIKPGTNLVLRNSARAPYPDGDAPDPGTTGRIMQFRVVPLTSPDTSYNPASRKPLLSSPMVRLTNPSKGRMAPGVAVHRTRQLTLNELMGVPVTVDGVQYPADSLGIFLNNTPWSGKLGVVAAAEPRYSELPQEGETEVWEIVNLTQDAHPIHIHLVEFQILNRQAFRKKAYVNAYNSAFPGGAYIPFFGPPLPYSAAENPRSGGKDGGNPNVKRYLTKTAIPPAQNEAGWKDTVVAYPGQVTRLAIRWAPETLPAKTAAASAFYSFEPNAGGYEYVWHCHILDHEDNEMMRPFALVPNASATRSYIQGADY